MFKDKNDDGGCDDAGNAVEMKKERALFVALNSIHEEVRSELCKAQEKLVKSEIKKTFIFNSLFSELLSDLSGGGLSACAHAHVAVAGFKRSYILMVTVVEHHVLKLTSCQHFC